jgi:hypothetical protein
MAQRDQFRGDSAIISWRETTNFASLQPRALTAIFGRKAAIKQSALVIQGS